MGDNTFDGSVMVGLIRCPCVGVLISKGLTVHTHIFDNMRAKFDVQQTLHRVATA